MSDPKISQGILCYDIRRMIFRVTEPTSHSHMSTRFVYSAVDTSSLPGSRRYS